MTDVDVRSSTARIDRGRKQDLLARYGLGEYWVVDPAQGRVEVSVLTDRGYGAPSIVDRGVLASPTIVGLTVDLLKVFGGL